MSRRNQGPRLRWLDKRQCFYITWTENGRSRERSTGTADREQAEIFFAEFLHARGRKDGPSDPSEMLVTDVLTQYAIAKANEVMAPRVIGCAVDALTSFWAGRTVVEVTKQTCKLYNKARDRSVNTIRRELSVLRAAINFAHEEGHITRPVHIELPEAPESRKRWLNRQEAARLIRASRTPVARLYLPQFILLGLYTGRRKEAILSLRWPQVDLKAGLIDFEIPDRKPTKKGRGTVRISSRLLPHLRRLRKRGTDLGYVLHINGRRIKDIKKGFEAACKRAGLEEVTPHTLRHTAATWLMQRGTPTWEAAGFLAMSEKMLRDVYGHQHPDFQKTAAENIGSRPKRA
jgi:integrase